MLATRRSSIAKQDTLRWICRRAYIRKLSASLLIGGECSALGVRPLLSGCSSSLSCLRLALHLRHALGEALPKLRMIGLGVHILPGLLRDCIVLVQTKDR